MNPYACKDRPAPGDPWLPVPCGYDESADDPKCKGCKWQKGCEHTVTVELASMGVAICDDCKQTVQLEA